MELSVVIPALNEADNLVKLLPQLHPILSALTDRYEIIVADNHSADATEEACSAGGARVVQQTEPGYGGALWAGFACARGEYVVTMDADLSHVPDFVPTMWERRADAEIVIASRYVPGGGADMPWYRGILSIILNVVYTKVLSLPVKDVSSGFRLYKASVLRDIELRSNDFDALEEILIKCYASGCRIVEVPFHYVPRDSGKSKVKLLQFGISYLRTLFRMWKLRNSIASADYDARAFDSVIPLQRYWQRQRHRIILSMVERDRSCLDVGCGSSRTLGALGAHAVGLDVEMPKLLYDRGYRRPLANGSAFALPFADRSFEQVICSEVIEHLPAGDGPFVEMARVLRDGGRLVLGTPDYGRLAWVVIERLYGFFAPDAYADQHITHYTQPGLVQKMQQLGFQLRQVRYICGGEMIAAFDKVERL